MMLYDPDLHDELEDVFHDAHETIANQIKSTQIKTDIIEEEEKGELI